MTFFLGAGLNPGDGARLLPELLLRVVGRPALGGVAAGASGMNCSFAGVFMGDFRIANLTGLAF
jgi:hypothetical protein